LLTSYRPSTSRPIPGCCLLRRDPHSRCSACRPGPAGLPNRLARKST
jgi:hypothetical protein